MTRQRLAGRTPKHPVSFRFHPYLLALLDERALKEGATRTDIMEVALLLYLRDKSRQRYDR